MVEYYYSEGLLSKRVLRRVGVGNGPTELAYSVILHVEPADRRRVEEQMLRHYYEVLTGDGGGGEDGMGGERRGPTKEEYPFDTFKKEYVMGGAERMLWLLAFMTASPTISHAWLQAYHGHVAAFLSDHGVTRDTIGVARCCI